MYQLYRSCFMYINIFQYAILVSTIKRLKKILVKTRKKVIKFYYQMNRIIIIIFIIIGIIIIFKTTICLTIQVPLKENLDNVLLGR